MPENEKRATQHIFHFRQMRRVQDPPKTRNTPVWAYFLSSARDRGAEYPKRAPMGVFEVFRLSRKGVGVMNRYHPPPIPLIPRTPFFFLIVILSLCYLIRTIRTLVKHYGLTSFDSFLYIDILTLYGHALTTHYCEL